MFYFRTSSSASALPGQTLNPETASFHFNIFTSNMEDMQSSLSVCLSVSNFAQKLSNGFAWTFQGKLAMDQ